jgi:hypothetical protein
LPDIKNDQEKTKLLKRINPTGFEPGKTKMHEGVRKMKCAMGEL